MPQSTLTLDADRQSLATLRSHWRFSMDRIEAEPDLPSGLAAKHVAFGAKLAGVITQDQTIKDAKSAADAFAFVADMGLNRMALRLKVAIHGPNQVDVTLPKHVLYFGNQTVRQAIRPILGPQLDMSVKWVEDLLPNETDPAFTALLQPTTDAVAKGNKAKAAVQAARTANEVFRLTGERRQIFDEYNILSAESLGALVAFAGAHPELELPADWPASFFLHVTADPGPQTAAEIDATLAALAEQQKTLEAKRAELELAETAAAQAATEAAQADADYQAKKKAAALSRKEERDAKARLAAAKKVARKTKKKAK